METLKTVNDISFMEAFGITHADLIRAINLAREQNVYSKYLIINQPILEYRGHKVFISPSMAQIGSDRPEDFKPYATEFSPLIPD